MHRHLSARATLKVEMRFGLAYAQVADFQMMNEIGQERPDDSEAQPNASSINPSMVAIRYRMVPEAFGWSATG
ncbi:MAG TPA: hypothetical protein VN647_07895 [Nitrospira sp.]|nr:hypothetical protein [Nitrospira sp.]